MFEHWLLVNRAFEPAQELVSMTWKLFQTEREKYHGLSGEQMSALTAFEKELGRMGGRNPSR